jgi:purine-nucleoside phosphorylase
LGDLAETIESPLEISYQDIPHFPVSTVQGHAGKLIFGQLSHRNVVAMQGRFHYYEGYDMKQVTYPVRVFQALGIKTLLVSNAAGGLQENFQIGDLMVIRDHINLFPEHPLRGKNDDRLGPRFPDMSKTYSERLIKLACDIAEEHHIPLHTGVYVGVSGPTFETPAEYRFFKLIGGEAIGMSTVPEVIVAHHAGIETFAISVITDIGLEGKIKEVSHEDVQEAARKAEPLLRELILELLNRC